MEYIRNKYEHLRVVPSPTNEHLHILFNYAAECNNAIETGVDGCVTSWAIAYGLLSNPNNTQRRPLLVVNDIIKCNVSEFTNACESLPITVKEVWKNNLEIDFTADLEDNTFDMIFIDTWHVYGQLKRELNKFKSIINKYIVMHDTTVDGIYGETIRQNMGAERQSIVSGIPVEEINRGLIPAIDEFLLENPEWRLKIKLENNNGLTILERVGVTVKN
jgi:hypothetical protein